MSQINEMLLDIIKQLKIEILEHKQTLSQEKNEKQKTLDYYWLLGLAQALSSIKRTIMSWHPLDTDEEYQELFKQYGLDFDIDKEYLQ